MGSDGDDEAPSGDIEDAAALDLLTPLQRFRRGNTLSVSDIASQAWCELQTAFSLEHRRRTTPAMKSGSKRHRQMELEVHDVREIRTVTAEDSWACRMLNTIFGIEELLTTGRTRELHVFGSLDPLRHLLQESNDDPAWAIGIIDLIEMRAPSDCDQQDRNGLIPFLVDNKTRMTASTPGFAQKRTSRIQMMLYKFLFDALAETTATDWIELFLRARDLDPGASITTPDVVAELERHGLHGRTLLQVCVAAVGAFRAVSPSSNSLQVVYEHQGTRAHLGDDTWAFDHDHLQGDVAYFMEFWTGVRPPNPVLSGEAWKCQMCQYRTRCSRSPYEQGDGDQQRQSP